MAHFAQLDENNKVTQIIVVDNKDTSDDKDVEQEEIGIAFCKSLFGEDTKWVQTSYNSNFRGVYASIGDTYDEENDVFVVRFDGYILDSEEIIDAEIIQGELE
jgi:hypothetical protein